MQLLNLPHPHYTRIKDSNWHNLCSFSKSLWGTSAEHSSFCLTLTQWLMSYPATECDITYDEYCPRHVHSEVSLSSEWNPTIVWWCLACEMLVWCLLSNFPARSLLSQTVLPLQYDIMIHVWSVDQKGPLCYQTTARSPRQPSGPGYRAHRKKEAHRRQRTDGSSFCLMYIDDVGLFRIHI